MHDEPHRPPLHRCRRSPRASGSPALAQWPGLPSLWRCGRKAAPGAARQAEQEEPRRRDPQRRDPVQRLPPAVHRDRQHGILRQQGSAEQVAACGSSAHVEQEGYQRAPASPHVGRHLQDGLVYGASHPRSDDPGRQRAPDGFGWRHGRGGRDFHRPRPRQQPAWRFTT